MVKQQGINRLGKPEDNVRSIIPTQERVIHSDFYMYSLMRDVDLSRSFDFLISTLELWNAIGSLHKSGGSEISNHKFLTIEDHLENLGNFYLYNQ